MTKGGREGETLHGVEQQAVGGVDQFVHKKEIPSLVLQIGGQEGVVRVCHECGTHMYMTCTFIIHSSCVMNVKISKSVLRILECGRAWLSLLRNSTCTV